MEKLLNQFNISINQLIATAVYVVVGVIVYELIKKVVNRIDSKSGSLQNSQRIKTIKSLVSNIIKYVIVIAVVLSILKVYGVNVTSLVAGLGITTAILGLAMQDSAKDFIAGMSIITESQYEVGDTIEIDGFMGEVISIGLKTTRIRNYKGATKIIANRYMDNIINYSMHDSLAIVEVGVEYKENPELIEEVLNNLATKLKGKIPNITGDIEVLGITNFASSSVVYRVTVETTPMEQYAVERQLRKEIQKEFAANNIMIPFPQLEVHNGK